MRLCVMIALLYRRRRVVGAVRETAMIDRGSRNPKTGVVAGAVLGTGGRRGCAADAPPDHSVLQTTYRCSKSAYAECIPSVLRAAILPQQARCEALAVVPEHRSWVSVVSKTTHTLHLAPSWGSADALGAGIAPGRRRSGFRMELDWRCEDRGRFRAHRSLRHGSLD